jgi:hypothetical protein
MKKNKKQKKQKKIQKVTKQDLVPSIDKDIENLGVD